MLTSGVVLLHDNARPHAVARTLALLQKFHWDLFKQVPTHPTVRTSPRVISIFFLWMQVWLGTQCLCVKMNEELMDGVKVWLSSQPAAFCDAGIVKLVSRCDTCLNSEGDYVRK